MKNIKIISILLLLGGSFSMAMTAKVKDTSLLQGTSIGKYSKPGASVDITYSTEKVDVSEISNVNITFTSSVTSGKMNISLNLGKGLNDVSDTAKKVTFDLAKNKSYPINFKVSADTDGRYYINLIVSINKRMRAFSVPVSIGNGKALIIKKPTHKDKNGERFIMQRAEETIIR